MVILFGVSVREDFVLSSGCHREQTVTLSK